MEPVAIAVFDIDGVIRDVGGSYRRAIADTVEHFTGDRYRPSIKDIDQLKSEGIWNNDWKASEALIHRYFQSINASKPQTSYKDIVDYFQKQYRGPDTEDPEQWSGYIANEPILVDSAYLQSLAASGVPYAFFSGATQGSAHFVLQRRIGLSHPILIAMEDAPSKPDPAGLMLAVERVESQQALSSPNLSSSKEYLSPENAASVLAAPLPVIYAGDTAADMQTVIAARSRFPTRTWLAIGILPPHAQKESSYAAQYASKLIAAGADTVFNSAREITAAQVSQLLSSVST